MANSKDKQKTVAKHLYMKGTPVAQIVELTGVSRQSVSRWINSEGWKEERAAREMSKEAITSRTLSKLGMPLTRRTVTRKASDGWLIHCSNR